MATKYLTCAETAKLIRQALKEAFPEVKFSVKSSVYSGGASIRVKYTDGPNTKQVEAVAKVFEGSYFDGMQDYKGSVNNMIDGITVRFGADFIFVNRDYSDALVQKGIDAVYREYAGNFKGDARPKVTVEDYRNGNVFKRDIPCMTGNYFGFSEVLNRKLCKMSDRLQVGNSATAGKVIYLGNDGYSQVGALNPQVLA